ncbi:hypothetical protein [Microscilla marina]|uniref:Uncharacterized protein n=1 Tax=Microscilla marina ATCC 23134 TaxID=313606 RepID=A1ZFP1_MICM2|nr:hypothetical protein [Microscilla marina]EAY30815.1 hypothetical protein M23134_01139 [Microscilla marina ATCC 23134]
MEVKDIYQAIDEARLYHTVSKQTKNNKTYIKFRRHDSVFTFIYTPEQTTTEGSKPAKYVLLKDKEKARLGTLRAMWQDYLEIKGEE